MLKMVVARIVLIGACAGILSSCQSASTFNESSLLAQSGPQSASAVIDSISIAPSAIPADTDTEVAITIHVPEGTRPKWKVTLDDQVSGGHIKREDKQGDLTTAQVYLLKLPAGQSRLVVIAESNAHTTTKEIPILSIPTPGNFSLNRATLDAGGPLEFDTFGGQYQHGGFVPPNSAEIVITGLPLPTNSTIEEMVRSDLSGLANDLAIEESKVGSVKCVRASYTDGVAAEVTHKTIVSYCPARSGEYVFKFFLSYDVHAPLAHEKMYADAYGKALRDAGLEP